MAEAKDDAEVERVIRATIERHARGNPDPLVHAIIAALRGAGYEIQSRASQDAGRPDPPPGSAEACARGCTCSPTLNCRGRGEPRRHPPFLCDVNCPMHGIEAAKRAVRAGKGRFLRRVRNPDQSGDGDEPTRH
jgi:hypothetical protein